MSDLSAGVLKLEVQQTAPITLDARLEVLPGQLLALLGPSGSGKTTLLRTIAGLHRPSRGFIVCGEHHWLDTEKRVNLPPQQRRAGLVFQDYALFPHMTALHNVSQALGHLPGGQRRQRAAELLGLVHLKGLEQRYPTELSGGQCQRVALARALAREPQVLLLDEPFSAVDQVTRRKLQQELTVLRRRINIPIVLVTHDLSEAAALADQICVLHRGRTLQQAIPDDILLHPVSPQVAKLMDQPNIYHGTIVEQHAQGGLLDWHGYSLEVYSLNGFTTGDEVSWMIPASHVILHRRDRPSRGERENPVAGIISEMIVFGEAVTVIMHVGGQTDTALTFTLPLHVARRNHLDAGVEIKVSLLADGIHLMADA